MQVLFRGLDDGSLVFLDHVVSLVVRSDKYELVFGKAFSPRVRLYPFRSYSLQAVVL